jgi:D-beta-D-heptose 7-phosphate kinase / D-beta-D-heptose 1-phosphate adenosyltransferase
MSRELLQTLDAFRGLRVLIVGDAMLDTYLHGSARRLSPEAPVPVVDIQWQRDVPGGAANTAANVAALGGDAVLVSVIGDDEDGATLVRELTRRGVNVRAVTASPRRTTLSKRRVMAGSQMYVRMDQGSTGAVGPEDEQSICAGLKSILATADAVIVSDYSYGVMTPEVIEQLAKLRSAAPLLLVVDAKELGLYRAVRPSMVKPNYAQALRLLGTEPAEREGRPEVLAASSEAILRLTGAEAAAVTLDAEGAILLRPGRPALRAFARSAEADCAAGAGDTFVSALTLALAAGSPLELGIDLAIAAASIVVGEQDTATCSAEALRSALAGDSWHTTSDASVEQLAADYRRDSKRIVFTNGCFDVLHPGHTALLAQARALGDVLIVGLNDDASVRRLKGSDRPVNPLEDRARVLASLQAVDHVIPFGEDTPERLIALIRPDVFVKGGDYSKDDLPEAPLVESFGGSVRILPFVEGHSTTKIIAQMRTIERPVGETLAASA